jgi:hypothetical protein
LPDTPLLVAHVLRISRVPQMRDRRLQRIEAAIERQQRVPAKGENDRLFPIDSTVEVGCLGPVGRSATELRFFHLATVFGLMPWRLARVLRLS